MIVTIILPTYNRSSLITTAIKSVLNQTFKNFELIIIDDGSTDNTKKIIKKFQKKDNRIIYIKNKKNLGIQKSLNKGLNFSKGKYIARIDDDDEWIDKNKLKKQIDFLELNKDHVLVGTNAIIVDEKGKEIFKINNSLNDYNIRKIILGKNCFLHPSVVFNKETALSLGGYDEEKETLHAEDYDLWLKMGCIGKFANLEFYGLKIRVSSNQISFKNRKIQTKKHLFFINKYKRKYSGYFLSLLRYYLRIILYDFLNLSKIKYFIYKILKKNGE